MYRRLSNLRNLTFCDFGILKAPVVQAPAGWTTYGTAPNQECAFGATNRLLVEVRFLKITAT